MPCDQGQPVVRLQRGFVSMSRRFNGLNLRNFSSGGALNLMTDDWEGRKDTSPQATTLSSPFGVLRKTVTSPSDSSSGNSPTYKAAARTEIALQWMNHNK